MCGPAIILHINYIFRLKEVIEKRQGELGRKLSRKEKEEIRSQVLLDVDEDFRQYINANRDGEQSL